MGNRRSPLINHQPDDELISAYLDGRLTDSEQAAFEMRLRADPALKRQVDVTRLLVTAARSLPPQPLPRDFTLPLSISAMPEARPRARASSLAWFLRVGSALATAVFVIAMGIDLVGLSAPSAQPSLPATQATVAVSPAQSEDSIAADAAITTPAESGAPAPSGAMPEAQPMQAMQQAGPSVAEAPEAQPAASEQAEPMTMPQAVPQVTTAQRAVEATPDMKSMQRNAETERAPSAGLVTQTDALPAPQPAEIGPSSNVATLPDEPETPLPLAAQPDATPWWRIVAGVAFVLAVFLGILGWRRS
ncbi:MAG: hypothetical protein ACUVR3_06305 [Candidatus Roseilinea sp.]|uniref:hypothetical protein n=1 Tax=Candidatus Roseilinea sp. TaxID=2838777 RepID=UPI004049AB26